VQFLGVVDNGVKYTCDPEVAEELSTTTPLAPPAASADPTGSKPAPKVNPGASRLKETMHPVPVVQTAGFVVPVFCMLMKM
jgi:hypothetical protein